jgi:hypothetical protein
MPDKQKRRIYACSDIYGVPVDVGRVHHEKP